MRDHDTTTSSMTEPYSEIGERVRLARHFSHLNQAEFAECIAARASHLSTWESGKVRLTLNAAMAIRRETGFTLDWLYFGDETTLPHKLFIWLRDNSDEAGSTCAS